MKRIEVLKGKTGWYWRLKAGNSKILAFSEIYSSKTRAMKTATSVYADTKNGVWNFVVIER